MRRSRPAEEMVGRWNSRRGTRSEKRRGGGNGVARAECNEGLRVFRGKVKEVGLNVARCEARGRCGVS